SIARDRPSVPTRRSSDLVGVRAYTQTTGTWVRGFLADDYGVDVNRIRWVTFEDPHLAEYKDPEIVERAPEGKTLKQMLLDGQIRSEEPRLNSSHEWISYA